MAFATLLLTAELRMEAGSEHPCLWPKTLRDAEFSRSRESSNTGRTVALACHSAGFSLTADVTYLGAKRWEKMKNSMRPSRRSKRLQNIANILSSYQPGCQSHEKCLQPMRFQ